MEKYIFEQRGACPHLVWSETTPWLLSQGCAPMVFPAFLRTSDFVKAFDEHSFKIKLRKIRITNLKERPSVEVTMANSIKEIF